MPRTTTANYDTLNTGAKKPVGIIELLDKDDAVLAKYSSGTFANIGSTGHKKYVSNIRVSTDSFDLIGNPFVGATNIEAVIIDYGLDVTSELNSGAVVKLQAKIGFQGLNASDFVSLPVQQILSINLIGSNEDSLAWRIVSRDVRSILTGTIFKHATGAGDTLNGAMTDSATSITISDGTRWIDPGNLSAGNGNLEDWLKAGIKIESEYLGHTATTTTTTLTVSRAQFGSTARAYDDGTKLRQFFYTVTSNLDNPFTWADMLLHICHTSEDGSGHAHYDLTGFDSNFAGFGLGMAEDEVETENIERLGQLTNIWQRVLRDNFYVIEQPENAADWISRNILIPNGLVAYINESGKLDVKLIDIIEFGENFSSSVTLDDDKIRNATLTLAYDQLRNNMEIIADTPIRYEYDTRLRGELDASVTAYGLSKPLTISAAVESASPVSPALEEDNYIAERWLYLFGNVPGLVNASVNFENWIYTVGDFALLTWGKFPDPTAGTRGWSAKKAIIIGQNAFFDFAELGNCEFSYNLFSWEATDKVSSFYTRQDKIEEGDITDTSATLSATETLSDPPEAADAHYDFTSTVQADLWKVTMRITPPNSGSTEHTIKLLLDAAEDSGGYMTRGRRRVIIRYNSGDSAAFTVKIMWAMGADNDCDRIYAQWYAASAGASERPTAVELIQVEYYTLDKSMTLSE